MTKYKDIKDDVASEFQYRKRYEVTCDGFKAVLKAREFNVSIPQAV